MQSLSSRERNWAIWVSRDLFGSWGANPVNRRNEGKSVHMYAQITNSRFIYLAETRIVHSKGKMAFNALRIHGLHSYVYLIR